MGMNCRDKGRIRKGPEDCPLRRGFPHQSLRASSPQGKPPAAAGTKDGKRTRVFALRRDPISFIGKD